MTSQIKSDSQGKRVKVLIEAESEFLADVAIEVARARAKFPGCEGLHAALAEEAGEVATALMDKPRSEIYKEAVQTAAMALRIALEGDPLFDGIRARRGLD